jgi:hypothetical protein
MAPESLEKGMKMAGMKHFIRKNAPENANKVLSVKQIINFNFSDNF